MPKVLIERRFEYEQIEPSSEWYIAHNLDITNPVVDVWLTSTGDLPYINSDAHEITIVDGSNIIITFFGQEVKGVALIT